MPCLLTAVLAGGGGSAVAVVTSRSASVRFSGGPTGIPLPAPPSVKRAGGRVLAQFRLGRTVAAQSGCLACHRIGVAGNRGPGRDLSRIGSRLSAGEIEHALTNARAPMPSFKHLPPKKLRALVTFLSQLRRR
jgi:menaquinol-cytochrome c reductase cytochrome b/c subunit